MRTVHLKTPARTGTLEIDERPDRVRLTLRFSRYGDLGDARELAEQLAPLIARYEGDGRPLVITDPRTGTAATFCDGGVAIVGEAAEAARPVPSYLPKVAALGAALKEGVHHVTVEHEAHCGLFSGGSTCTCVARVRYGLPGGRDAQ